MASTVPLSRQRHPTYLKMISTWQMWGAIYEGGEDLINNALYLRRYSKRETTREFTDRKALTYNPESTATWTFLADTLLAMGKDAEARAALQHVLDAPLDPEWTPEDREFKEKAKRRLTGGRGEDSEFN